MTSFKHIDGEDLVFISEALAGGNLEDAYAKRDAYTKRVLVRFATALANRDGSNTVPMFDAIQEWAKRSAAELDQLLDNTQR